MADPIKPEVARASLERAATQLELDAALKVFEASCYRRRAASINGATQRAHAALQTHLDAIAAGFEVSARDGGF